MFTPFHSMHDLTWSVAGWLCARLARFADAPLLLKIADDAAMSMAVPEDETARLLRGLVGTLAFGFVGILLAVLGLKIFDWLSPKIDVPKELTEKQNMAVAVVSAAFILGICYIVATVVH